MTYFSILFLNMDRSFNIQDRLLKFSVVIIDMLMEGTVSHFFNSGPGLYFVSFQK